MTRLEGAITLVQERRFQLVDERGIAHPFTLAADASFDPSELPALARSGQRVRVEYTDDGEALSHVAHDLMTFDRGSTR
ncbi:MAG TPA: hypothetical protein VHP37_29905 [Burkholderiales bacterium]|nr:hypothetical protein [Burkholderiales bacterium]